MPERNGPRGASDSSTAELVKQLADQTTALVRQEVELAKAELAEKGKRVGIGAGMFGGAGVLGLYALGALTATFILLLATVIDQAWLAALIVAAVYGAIAGVLALLGRNQVQEATPAAPERTVETVKEDVEWVKQSAKTGRR
ncbi:MAG: phage holin family protein [Solirubrobacteraceae bacterium]